MRDNRYYIGHVGKNSLTSTRTGKQLRKTLLQDERGRGNTRRHYSHCLDNGDRTQWTSAIGVNVHNKSNTQSRSSQTIEHMNRLQALPPMQPTETNEKMVTLLEISANNQQNMQGSRNFTCQAQIKQIHTDRGWYYVSCSKCSNKLYPEQEGEVVNYVCKDDDNITPNFKYCVNATITDATGTADAVFFNESMYAMLNINCKDMVTKHASTTNPKKIPQLITSIVDISRLLHLTVKNDGKIVVNNVTEVTSTYESQSTGTIPGPSTFTPPTPIPKKSTPKRQLSETPG
ncbi:hypothetical protein CASFOL_014425 [Castilleja foliolosa]|uniref:Replication factor A C-terminal domain-containing protein n=1 Tax=Castilleja foliolosa TaxID=1961234 RepID=A0ABD3DMY2_9LAMI